MPVIRKDDLEPVTGSGYPPPYNESMGRYQAWPLSEAGGLTQFGAYLETLEPGAQSSHRHWHEAEDEFLYMLQGAVTVIDSDGEHTLEPGDAVCWKAGDPNAHCLKNHTNNPATYLLVGTRAADEICHYPDIDLKFTREAGKGRFTRADGTEFEQPGEGETP